jgi:hypothetical protein
MIETMLYGNNISATNGLSDKFVVFDMPTPNE